MLLRDYLARAFDVSDGASRIVAERRRQIASEGYSLDHDRGLGAGQLAGAAEAYLTGSPQSWPWSPDSLKLSGDISRNLEKAGALIAAAIDVLRHPGDGSQSDSTQIPESADHR